MLALKFQEWSSVGGGDTLPAECSTGTLVADVSAGALAGALLGSPATIGGMLAGAVLGGLLVDTLGMGAVVGEVEAWGADELLSGTTTSLADAPDNNTAAWFLRGMVSVPAEEKDPVAGLKISSVLPGAPEPSPPAIRTRPSARSVAVWPEREANIESPMVQERVAGL